ncbi:unnamed protein product [Polarella glacialis]|uniref:Uncharacterized protein n=1 Tax=Polarella glacialis TaxID=89957 RepID=A0A813D8P5_POLGL|nr:unnamed protein product [Polarella glacialis]
MRALVCLCVFVCGVLLTDIAPVEARHVSDSSIVSHSTEATCEDDVVDMAASSLTLLQRIRERKDETDSIKSERIRLRTIASSDGVVSFPWPFFFLHVPKAGGGFTNSVYQTACPCLTSDNLGFEMGPGLWELPECCWKENGWKFGTAPTYHYPASGPPFESLPEPRWSHVIAMFRNPRQRVLSAFFHNRHSCEWLNLRDAPDCNSEDKEKPECAPLQQNPSPRILEEYTKCVGCCQSRMLSGFSCGTTKPNRDVTDFDAKVMTGCGDFECEGVPAALLTDRLQQIDHMGFVGLTEEFSLSICMWHMRYGGGCSNIEFGDFRPGSHSSGSSGYDEINFTAAALAILADDEAVYAKASARFWNDIHEFKELDKCVAACQRQITALRDEMPKAAQEAEVRALRDELAFLSDQVEVLRVLVICVPDVFRAAVPVKLEKGLGACALACQLDGACSAKLEQKFRLAELRDELLRSATHEVAAQGSASAEQLAALRDELLAAVPSAPDLAPLRDDLLSLSQRTEALASSLADSSSEKQIGTLREEVMASIAALPAVQPLQDAVTSLSQRMEVLSQSSETSEQHIAGLRSALMAALPSLSEMHTLRDEVTNLFQQMEALVQGSAESEKQLGLLRDELLAKMPRVPDLQPLQDELLRLSKRTEAVPEASAFTAALREEVLAALPALPDVQTLQQDLVNVSRRTEAGC